MDGGIAPSLIEETSCPVEMVEVVFINLAPPKLHVADFKVAPEVTCRVTLGLPVVFGSIFVIRNPFDGIVLL